MSDAGTTPDELAQQQDAAREGKASADERGDQTGTPVSDPLNEPGVDTDEGDALEQGRGTSEDAVPDPVTEPGVNADEADVLEQSMDVPDDEEDRR